MDPKLLYQLSEVIEQGSISQAADKLNVTQPTLSRNMKLIEEIVGAPILHRGRHTVTPTRIGERLAEHGRIIQDTVHLANDSVRHMNNGISNEIRLGIGDMLSVSMLPEYLDKHSLMDTNYSLNIVTSNPPSLLQMLYENSIDMAIAPAWKQKYPNTILEQPLFNDKLCVVAGSRSPLCAIEEKVNKKLLADQPWISVYYFAHLRHLNDDWVTLLNIEHIVPKIRFNGNVSAAWRVMKNSNWLALIPSNLAELFVNAGGIKILDLDAEMPIRNISLWMLNTVDHEPSVQEMANNLKSHFYDDKHHTFVADQCQPEEFEVTE